jgi:hypothetical protein
MFLVLMGLGDWGGTKGFGFITGTLLSNYIVKVEVIGVWLSGWAAGSSADSARLEERYVW